MVCWFDWWAGCVWWVVALPVRFCWVVCLISLLASWVCVVVDWLGLCFDLLVCCLLFSDLFDLVVDFLVVLFVLLVCFAGEFSLVYCFELNLMLFWYLWPTDVCFVIHYFFCCWILLRWFVVCWCATCFSWLITVDLTFSDLLIVFCYLCLWVHY